MAVAFALALVGVIAFIFGLVRILRPKNETGSASGLTLLVAGAFVTAGSLGWATWNWDAADAVNATGVQAANDARRQAEINEIKYQRMARDFVLPMLKDPDSAQFRNQRGFCGEVNSKNLLGGYVGFQRFIAADKAMVVMENDSALAPGAFADAWQQFCRQWEKSPLREGLFGYIKMRGVILRGLLARVRFVCGRKRRHL